MEEKAVKGRKQMQKDKKRSEWKRKRACCRGLVTVAGPGVATKLARRLKIEYCCCFTTSDTCSQTIIWDCWSLDRSRKGVRRVFSWRSPLPTVTGNVRRKKVENKAFEGEKEEVPRPEQE